jgi:hypothetical protein
VRLFVRWFGVLCVPAIIASAVSFAGSMGNDANLTTAERSVEWLRSHHFGGLVSWVETQYYSRHQPRTGGTLPSGLPNAASAAPPLTAGPPGAAAVGADAIVPFAKPSVPGEGVWQPYGDQIGTSTAMQVAYLRPDAVQGTVVAAVVRIDQSRALFRLIPGSEEPGHGPWPAGNTITGADRPLVVAAFNSGFRIADARGGFEQSGRVVGRLRTGAATLVVSPSGSADIVTWTAGLVATTHPVAVRQNLDLIVDGGALVGGLDDNAGNRWGQTVGNRLFVWRSGIGIDASGRLLYAASSGLSVSSLARLLQRAGAVRAMELDINHSWVTFNAFHHGAGGISGAKLLAGMAKPASRYLAADARDFVAVVARQPPGAGTT